MKHSHLRGLKLLFCATLALAIVLSLLPAQEAKALKQGQTCPDCGTGILIPINYTSEQHAFSCSKTSCIHSTSDGYIWENHHGGNACTGRPICEGCGREYGSPNPAGHNWDTNWSFDENGHYHKCLNNGCTAKNDEAAHSGGTATCQTKAVCATCGQSYGTVDTVNGHNWDTNWSYDETNHYHKCLNDGCTARKDEAAHSGGAATCVSGPICDECGQEYGSALGHDWQTEWTIDGDAHYHACSRCTERKDEAAHNYVWTYLDDSTHKGVCACGAETTVEHVWNGSHWCGYPRKCKDCGEYYGEVLDHEYWYEYKTDEQHKINCYHCDGLFGREDHSGGTATCIAKAVCEKCKAEYGEYAAHKGGTATCTEKAVCEICGQEYGDPLDHDWATAWTQGDTTHYYACSRCTERKDEAPHSYSWTYVDDNTCKGECTCGAETTEAHYDRWEGRCNHQPHCEKCDHDYGSIGEHDMWYEDCGESGHKPNCYHCDTYFFLEPHSGGTATCVKGPICEKCSAEYGEPDPDNHHWGDWIDDADPVNLTHTRTCQRAGCGATETEAHHEDEIENSGPDWHDYICYVCSSGGMVYRNEIHSYGDWQDNGDGNHTRTCAPCGRTETEAHSGGTATCTEKATCETCGVEYGKPLGHDLIDHEAQAPTCTAIGWDAYQTCSRCDYTTYAEKKALGHDLIDHEAQAPTCTAIGWDAYQTCSRCDYTTYTEKKALGHDLIDHEAQAPTCTAIGWDAYQTCSRCDYTTCVEKKELGHDLIDHEEKAPTCTEIGWDAYQTCSRCDYTTYVEKKALGHDLIDHPAQAPTCTAIGWDAYQTCSRCDYTTYAEKKALGHDLIDHAAQAPTCTEIGWDAYQTCSRCDYTTYTEKKALGHDLIDHEAQAPTCTAIGWDAYQTCSRCDYTTYAEKKALGHDLIDHAAQAPTCTEIGWDAYQTCSRCDYTTYTEKKALGHDLIEHEAQAPTCTIIGWDAYQTCSRCDYTTYVENKALGHDLIDHEAQAPTCTVLGWDAYQTCSRCDYSTYAEKPALGHSGMIGAVISPTCTEPGLTEGTYCLRCGSVLTAPQVIPALEHDYTVTQRTITRIYYRCSRCRDSYWIDNAKSRNLLPGLVWNDRDENVEYTAGVAKANGIKVLTVTPDAEAVEDSAWVSLRLKPGDVEQWKREGIGTVAFQCGEARLEISLSALTPDWFELDAPLDCYVFTLAPEDDGTLVTVEAAIGAEKAPADAYGGITLGLGDEILEIIQNGIY